MHVSSNPYRSQRYKRGLFLISIVIMLTGLGVALLVSKWSRFLGVGLFIIGVLMFHVTTRIGLRSLTQQRGFFFARDEAGRIPIISERIVSLFTFHGRYPQLMLIAAILLAVGVVCYNS